MLNQAHLHQIHKMTNKQEKEIKELVQDIASDDEYDFKKETIRIISKQKDLYLKEILDSYQNNSTLEKRYTTSDILTILENIFDELKLSEFEN